MEGQSGLSELSFISWVSAIQGCPLSGVPLYIVGDSLVIILYGILCLPPLPVVQGVSQFPE